MTKIAYTNNKYKSSVYPTAITFNKDTYILSVSNSEIYISRKSVYPIKKKSDIKSKVFWRLGENSIDETSAAKECEWTTI